MARSPSPPTLQPRLSSACMAKGGLVLEKGAIGDRGNDGFDTMFNALKLSSSTSVEANSTPRFPDTYPVGSLIHWEFPARENRAPVTIHGYDGDLSHGRRTNFEFEPNVVEAVRLGSLAVRLSAKCDWDAENQPVSRIAEAQAGDWAVAHALINPPRRSSWQLASSADWIFRSTACPKGIPTAARSTDKRAPIFRRPNSR